MALIMKIQINNNPPLAIVAAVRDNPCGDTINSSDPNQPATYDVELHQQRDLGTVAYSGLVRTDTTTVTHRYDDGHLVLARKALDAVVLTDLEDPHVASTTDAAERAEWAAAVGEPCYICGDPDNHAGQPHSDATGDGWTRATADHRQRLTAATQTLTTLLDAAVSDAEEHRLRGKREGIQLALTYLGEPRRARL